MTPTETTDVRGTEYDTVSEEVIFTVAETVGRDPTEVEPLYDVVDPDALDTLLQSWRDAPARSGGRVEFRMEGCEVTVRANGEVDVTPQGNKVESRSY